MRDEEAPTGAHELAGGGTSRGSPHAASTRRNGVTLDPLEATIWAAIQDNVTFSSTSLALVVDNAEHRAFEAACWQMYRAKVIDNVRGYWCPSTADGAIEFPLQTSARLSELGLSAVTCLMQGVPIFRLQPPAPASGSPVPEIPQKG